jgi:hypothetical protein
MVGRVLADCNIAPYPDAEIAKATQEMKKQTDAADAATKKRRHYR